MTLHERLITVALAGPWCACTAGWALVVSVLVPFSDRTNGRNRR